MTHDSFAISDDVLAEFERAMAYRSACSRRATPGSMVNQAILTRDAPLADVLFGVDNTFLSRALEADIFEPTVAGAARRARPSCSSTRGRVTPIDYGDVCLNYDRAAFAGDLPPPATLEELADERYRGMLVVQNPATSSPGLAFLLATVAASARTATTPGATTGRAGRERRARHLRLGGGLLRPLLGGAGEGDRPIVVSYATSPAAEVFFADPPPDEAPTAVVDAGCFRQVEFAGILAGTEQPARAGAHRLHARPSSRRTSRSTCSSSRPVTEAELPEVFVEHAAQIAEPMTIDPARDRGRARALDRGVDRRRPPLGARALAAGSAALAAAPLGFLLLFFAYPVGSILAPAGAGACLDPAAMLEVLAARSSSRWPGSRSGRRSCRPS
jgi:thiamine transport system substrate-binding protein